MNSGKQLAVFVIGLVFGTGASISAKTLFMVDIDGKLFEKPIYQTFLMFVGMFLSLPIYFLFIKPKEKENDGEKDFDYEKLEDKEENEEVKSKVNELNKKTVLFLAIPSVFDLIATVLANKGLILIDVSVYQLMKCTVIVFVALVKYLFLSTEYSLQMKIGILLNTIAVCFVASTSFFPDEVDLTNSTSSVVTRDTGEKLLGILFVVMSCVVQSLQYVFEEKVMANDEVHPMVVVGMEGFWGIVFNVCLVLPIAYFMSGSDCVDGYCCYENSVESFTVLYHSSVVLTLSLVYVVVITGYNIFACYVTYYLDSVWHAILDNFRPISVWIVELLIYQVYNGRYGETLDKSSYLQLLGLLLLLYGTAVYNNNVTPPCLSATSSPESE